MAKDKITGAVFVAGRTYVEGDETALTEHFDGLKADVRKASVDHLVRSGAIEGFGGKGEVEPVPGTVPVEASVATKKSTRKGGGRRK
jgi:hypothetical protein